ncbi:MAG: SPOR domain-containing protein, partial [Bacteroidaceae bacterium]|nr:SPOR domain-containing protein [Bacteroidaceae bacterium]
MKKTLMMGIALVAALAFVSCKSSESSYKKAYEKAKANEQAQTIAADQVETAPVSVTPVISTPVAP